MTEPTDSPDGLPKTQQELNEIINDGKDIIVKSSAPDSSAQTIKIKKVPRHQMGALLLALSDEVKEIALYTGQSEQWVKGLDEESFEAAIEEGRRINFTRFAKWYQRQKDSLKVLGLMKEGTLEAIAREEAAKAAQAAQANQAKLTGALPSAASSSSVRDTETKT